MNRQSAIKALLSSLSELRRLPSDVPVRLLLVCKPILQCPKCGQPEGRFYTIDKLTHIEQHCSNCGYKLID